jgi:hypothetical protein
MAPASSSRCAALLLLLSLLASAQAAVTTFPAGTVTARRTGTVPYVCVLETDCAHSCFGEFTISTTAGSSSTFNPTPVAGCTCLAAVGSSTSATFTDGGPATVRVTDCRVSMTASPGGTPCTNEYTLFPCASAGPSPPPPAASAGGRAAAAVPAASLAAALVAALL